MGGIEVTPRQLERMIRKKTPEERTKSRIHGALSQIMQAETPERHIVTVLFLSRVIVAGVKNSTLDERSISAVLGDFGIIEVERKEREETQELERTVGMGTD